MESPLIASPILGAFSGQSSRSRSSTKLDDVQSLTSFNPFAEEDENDQSSYTLVTNIFSRMKNSLAPLSSAVTAASSGTTNPITTSTTNTGGTEARRTSYNGQSSQATTSSKLSAGDRRFPLAAAPTNPAPPLVSLTPVQSEAPTYSADYEKSPASTGFFSSPVFESAENGIFGTAIPGFPIQDDARSIKTVASLHRSVSVSKVIRRIRGEGNGHPTYDVAC